MSNNCLKISQPVFLCLCIKAAEKMEVPVFISGYVTVVNASFSCCIVWTPVCVNLSSKDYSEQDDMYMNLISPCSIPFNPEYQNPCACGKGEHMIIHCWFLVAAVLIIPP